MYAYIYSNYILMIAEIYSVLPIVYFIYILTKNKVFGLYILIISIMVDIIKKIVATDAYPFTLRPTCASNCDLLLSNGPQGLKPGFPSGHMTISTLFALYLYTTTHNIWHLHLIPLMAYARYTLKCHNIPQIIAGIIFGLVSFYFYLNQCQL
jgi:membrane-associated phospholipid phosphatase